jgi:hypothetical protein
LLETLGMSTATVAALWTCPPSLQDEFSQWTWAVALLADDVAVQMELKRMHVWLEQSTGWVFPHKLWFVCRKHAAETIKDTWLIIDYHLKHMFTGANSAFNGSEFLFLWKHIPYSFEAHVKILLWEQISRSISIGDGFERNTPLYMIII